MLGNHQNLPTGVIVFKLIVAALLFITFLSLGMLTIVQNEQTKAIGVLCWELDQIIKEHDMEKEIEKKVFVVNSKANL
jgi:hypothetical protein